VKPALLSMQNKTAGTLLRSMRECFTVCIKEISGLYEHSSF
jgi:hypothetical protein